VPSVLLWFVPLLTQYDGLSTSLPVLRIQPDERRGPAPGGAECSRARDRRGRPHTGGQRRQTAARSSSSTTTVSVAGTSIGRPWTVHVNVPPSRVVRVSRSWVARTLTSVPRTVSRKVMPSHSAGTRGSKEIEPR